MQETLDPLDIPSQEIFRTEEGISITVTKNIPEEEYDILWDMVETGFRELNLKSYEKQDMTRDELEADLRSDNVLKYVARDTEKGLVGLLTVHIGLGNITWTDVDKLLETQEQVDSQAKPYYVGTIVVPTSERGTSAATNLIRGALLHFNQVNTAKDKDSLVFFDCAEANYPWLGQFIQEVGSPSEQFPHLNTRVDELYTDAWVEASGEINKIHDAPSDIAGTVLDKQHYYAINIDR